MDSSVNQDELMPELRQMIAETLDVDQEMVGDDTHFVDDLGVDSLMALEVMVTLERKYKIKLTEEDLQDIVCLRQVHGMVLNHLAASPSRLGTTGA